MLRVTRTFGLILALAALAALPAAAQDSVAGKWILTSQSPETGSISSEFVFEQNGTEVTGTASIDIVEAAEISDGLYEDNVLSFLLHVSIEGQYFTAEVEADVDGDEMTGEFYVPDMGQGIPFSGRRAAN